MKSEAVEEKKRFAEDFGTAFERQGMPRMSGRIVAWLLVSDEPYQSAHDIMEALRASKASISTVTRLLIRLGFIERASLLGERRDYFRIKPGALHHHFRGTLVELTSFRQLAERGMELVQDKNAISREWLEDALSIYTFFEREFPVLLERWEKEHKRTAH